MTTTKQFKSMRYSILAFDRYSQILEPGFAGNDAEKRCEGPREGTKLKRIFVPKCTDSHNGIWFEGRVFDVRELQNINHAGKRGRKKVEIERYAFDGRMEGGKKRGPAKWYLINNLHLINHKC